ncbi:piercer of microtubule wall 1 protein isoform X3 [Muntiacus reevesi]|uniref:piercer of microtubule wall 1 protein isoform X3 n=1 Tax=Muntiacus reevesi TaxID=9886 RepID=UPI0033073153
MSEEDPQASAEPEEPKAGPPPEKTSDCYRVSEDLPARFNNPAWFRGYRTKEPLSVYRTSNQAYGSRAPTVHEMPEIFPTQRSNPCLLCLLCWLAASVPAEPPGKPVPWFPTSQRTGPIHSYNEPALIGSRF